MSSLFEMGENTRYFQVLSNESRRAVNGGLETICYSASLLWTNLPPEYKLENSLNIFKRKIKNWKGENCPCRLCKTYVRELGHIQFARSLSIFITFFFCFNTIKKTSKAQPFTEKRIKKFPVIYIILPSVDFNQFQQRKLLKLCR